MNTKQKVVLIGLSGCSSTGKTTIAKLTAELVNQSTLIHEDDFYKHDDEVPIDPKRNIANWDSPEALDFPLFRKELGHIRESGDIKTELIHNNNVDDLKKFKIKPEILENLKQNYSAIDSNLKIVIVDGFMMFNDPEVRSKLDIKILIRAPYEQLKQRRAARLGYQTLDSFWVDPPYYFDEFVYKSYAETHGPLFINNDVEGHLDPVKASDIQDFMNSDEVAIEQTLQWVCNIIVNSCKDL
ncbi:nicotinamide riboside kinase [Monosporozyma unispora]|nr:ribosylnicotinamide kinase [Kazachstania unispora]